MVIEIVGGFIANSLALLSDGLHMFRHSFSRCCPCCIYLCFEKNATSSKTFGYKRFEVLAALFNGVTLFVISIVIIVEAIKRFLHHPKFNQQKCLLLV